MSAIGTSDESEETEKPKKLDRFARLEEGFTEQFASIGVMVMAFHQADGLLIVQRANPLANKLVGVARQNPAVYKALKKYMDGSAYMMLAEELGVIALGLLANHGVNPVGWLIDRAKGKQADGNADLSAVA